MVINTSRNIFKLILNESDYSGISDLVKYLKIPINKRKEDLVYDFPEEYKHIVGADYLRKKNIKSVVDLQNKDRHMFDDVANIMYDIVTNHETMHEYDVAEYPSWAFFDNPKIVYNQWMIRFSNKPSMFFVENGMVGFDNINRLGLTTKIEVGRGITLSKEGFGFSFLIDNITVSDYLKYSKVYGSNAVIFRASGVEVYHIGDKDRQVIYPVDTARFITPIKMRDGIWMIYDKDQILYYSKSIDDIKSWIGAKYKKYFIAQTDNNELF